MRTGRACNRIQETMKPSVLTLLLCATLSQVCLAAEPTVCKSLCATEKRECRAHAVNATLFDADPVLAPEERNRDARALGKLEGKTAEGRSREQSDFQKRKMERDHACDDQQMRCARACNSEPESASSVLVKPSAKH
jgi:hypothetical protein